VVTGQGPIVGTHSAAGVERYAGIPFAVPPLGARRFTRAEENIATWAGGVLNASRAGPPCLQNPLGDPRPMDDDEAPPPSEDCLQLNVFRPAAPSPAPLPVMVYAFGGGLCSGFAGNRVLNGSELALRQDVIVVTVSYRLGALGFLPLADFPGEGSGGMNGIHDVIVALQWLQRNLQAFGGNPAEVTLFGQSSGSYLSCTISVSPLARGLLSRAILQSGPCIGGPPGKGWGPASSSYGASVTAQVMASLNVTTIDQLRQLPAETIQWPDPLMNDLTTAPYFSGYFDDTFVAPLPVEDLWRSGSIVPSSLIIGHTSKDGTAAFYGTSPTLGLVPPDPQQEGDAAYLAALQLVWGNETADAIHEQYPLAAYNGSAQAAFIQADADAFVICPSLELAAVASAQRRDVWVYEFAHFQPNRDRADGWGCDNGVELDVVAPVATPETERWATHGADVSYVFGNQIMPDSFEPHNLSRCDFAPAEAQLSHSVTAYWGAMARTGNPNTACRGGACSPWPRYAGRGQRLTQLLVAGAAPQPVAMLHASDCRFWEGLWATKSSRSQL